MSSENSDENPPVVIKKYANRRLYNTATSAYVTLDDLATMVKQGEDFQVFDAKTNEDITRSVLTQIIFEEEGKGNNLLPINFLRQLIRFYDDSLQVFVPGYLELSLKSLVDEQENLRQQMLKFGQAPFKAMEEQTKQNMAMFVEAMQMFNPFAPPPAAEAEKPAKADENPAADIEQLRDQLGDLQRQLEEMAARTKK